MKLTLANKITIGRFILIPILVATILSYTPDKDHLRWVALGIYLFAEITDVIDGFIARHFRQKTKAGSILDPLADKVLFLATLLCLYKIGGEFHWPGRMPLWLVVAFFTRDTLLLIGGLLVEVKRGFIEIKPNIWGKLTAFLQVICLVAVFLQLYVPLFVWGAALAVTVVSGVFYMAEGIKVINNDGNR
ncbi:MAG: CDP-alcohol phosphatidyltransferase family protein [Candidatus Omnitrophica bacterium]|nr:CDP-alcohol phosphatidyltransferase family protein [Candidatus Omnitrophota bacterium]